MKLSVALHEFDDEARRLLEYSRQVGVVLDFVVVKQLEEEAEEQVHREAAVLGIREASRIRGLPPPCGEPEWGRHVDLATFYGTSFDQKQRRLLLSAGDDVLAKVHRQEIRGDKPFGPYTWSDQDDLDHLLWFDEAAVPTGKFTFAFTQPPYGLKLTHPEIQRLFVAMIDVILHNPTEDTEIWEWHASGRWAPYFIPGEDWWGAAAWTVRVNSSSLVVIGASATDV